MGQSRGRRAYPHPCSIPPPFPYPYAIPRPYPHPCSIPRPHPYPCSIPRRGRRTGAEVGLAPHVGHGLVVVDELELAHVVPPRELADGDGLPGGIASDDLDGALPAVGGTVGTRTGTGDGAGDGRSRGPAVDRGQDTPRWLAFPPPQSATQSASLAGCRVLHRVLGVLHRVLQERGKIRTGKISTW